MRKLCMNFKKLFIVIRRTRRCVITLGGFCLMATTGSFNSLLNAKESSLGGCPRTRKSTAEKRALARFSRYFR